MPGARFDLAVVGAGPAGAAAASAALRAGLSSVALIDRAVFPRDKPCGGGLTHHAFSGLDAAGLSLRVPAVWPLEAWVTGGPTHQSTPLFGSCAVVRRAELDADLVSQARASGAQLLEEFSVEAMDSGPRGILLSGKKRRLTARAVVFCGGVSGIGRRLLGLPAGLKARLRLVDVAASSSRALALRFDLARSGGYYWEFPSQIDGTPCWNCGVYQAAGPVAPADLTGELEGALERSGRAIGERPIRSYAARRVEPGGPLGRDGALLAGEELGVEPLAGEGIALALWTGAIAGRLAAREVCAGRAPTIARYRRALWSAPPWRALLLMRELAERLYGAESSRYQKLALGSQKAASLLTALISGRRSLVAVLLGLSGVYGYHRALGLLRRSP
jgi:flavin-dependent dehydrogenase